MNEHALDHQPDSTGQPSPFHAPEPSIVDTILNLDELLSAEVRRAEKTARFCTQPQIEADIDNLAAELSTLVDPVTGNPLDTGGPEASVGDSTGRTARTVALELYEKQREYAAAFRSVRMRQMSDDDWTAFRARHQKAFDSQGPSPERTAMFNELVVKSASHPQLTTEQWLKLRSVLGGPAIDELIDVAWVVNTESGVSVPKSPLSSHVLKRTAPSRS